MSNQSLRLPYSDQLAVHWFHIQPPPPGWYFARMALSTQENSLLSTLLCCVFFFNNQMEEMHRKRCGERDLELPCPLWALHPPSASMHWARLSGIHCWRLLWRLQQSMGDWVNHWPSTIRLVLQLLSLSQKLGGRWRAESSTLWPHGWFPGTQPTLLRDFPRIASLI